MNKYQLNYAKAKANYIIRNKQREKLGRPYWEQWEKGKLDVDDLISKEAAIDIKVGHTKALDRLHKATQELITWARDDIKGRFPERYNQIKDAFEKGMKHPQFRDKLIDICMRYQPTSVITKKAPKYRGIRITPKRPRLPR